MLRVKKNNNAFTLIELLVVVAIIGALAAGMFGRGTHILGEDSEAVVDVADKVRQAELIRQEQERISKKAKK